MNTFKKSIVSAVTVIVIGAVIGIVFGKLLHGGGSGIWAIVGAVVGLGVKEVVSW